MPDLSRLRVSLAGTDELPDVRSLFLEYRDSLGVDLSFQRFDEEVAGLPGAYAAPGGRLLLARSGEDVAGCAALRPWRGTACEMKRLYLRPSFRGGGRAHALVERLLLEARAAGYTRILLDTLPTMTAARALYASFGFRAVEPYTANPIEGTAFLGLDLPALAEELVAMDAHDQAVRAELDAAGVLEGGYHPRMEKVHVANAARLLQIVDVHGWPGHALAGEAGAFAAWRIAQHAIGEPDVMRRCRDLLDAASRAGDVPRWQHAYIDDRIRVFEGKPQRFGTQSRDTPEGPAPYPIEEPETVNERRARLGMPPLPEAPPRRSGEPAPSRDWAALERAGREWRVSVGWIEEG